MEEGHIQSYIHRLDKYNRVVERPSSSAYKSDEEVHKPDILLVIPCLGTSTLAHYILDDGENSYANTLDNKLQGDAPASGGREESNSEHQLKAKLQNITLLFFC